MKRLLKRLARISSKPSRPQRRRASGRRLECESLEGRQMLTGVVGGVLQIDNGTPQADEVAVEIDTKSLATKYDDTVVVKQNFYGSNTQFEFDLYSFKNNKYTQNIKCIRWYARGGDDTFTNDTQIRSKVYGGAGNDRLRGGFNADLLLGGVGKDNIWGGNGADSLYGDGWTSNNYGDGDIIRGGQGNDWIVGGPGSDWIFGGDEEVGDGGAGVGVVVGPADKPVVQGDGPPEHWVIGAGDGNDRILGCAGNDFIFGQGGNDKIWGGFLLPNMNAKKGMIDHDQIFGGAGLDRLTGGNGNDTLYGGPGDDRLSGQFGDDVLHGDQGADLAWGGHGNDQLWGEQGNDRMYGGVGIDELIGGDGDDLLYGQHGDDLLLGGAGNDQLVGGLGADCLFAGEGEDYLYGNAGNDELFGGLGADRLFGGAGSDYLIAGDPGAFVGDGSLDYLKGGAGPDKFEKLEAIDILMDFFAYQGDTLI